MGVDNLKLKNAFIAPWSYSMLKDFETCPKQYYHKRVLKEIPFVETEQIRYGNEFHKAVEMYINDGTDLPKSFQFAKDAIDKIVGKAGEGGFIIAEIEMGVTEDGVPCSYKNYKEGWHRGKLDLMLINRKKRKGYIIDWKTGGNPNYADPGQLETNSMLVFKSSYGSEIDSIEGALVYVLSGKLLRYKYDKSGLPDIWSKWEKKYNRFKRAHKEGTFNPKQNGLCKSWCPVTECPYNGANR